MDSMSDLSFTQASRSMSSKPISRVSNEYKPWWQIVSEHNKKPKQLTLRENGKRVKVIGG